MNPKFKTIIGFLFVSSLILTGCASGPVLETTFIPSLTATAMTTQIPTITPTPTLTYTPTQTPTPTITPTITPTPMPTPMSGANSLVLSCTLPNNGGYFEYNLITKSYSLLLDTSKSSRLENLSFQFALLGLEVKPQDILPDEVLNSSCCTSVLAVSGDKRFLLVQKLGPTVNDSTYLYWVDVANRKAIKIASFLDDGTAQETKIDPKDGNFVVVRMPEKPRQNLYLINLQTGKLLNDFTAKTTGQNKSELNTEQIVKNLI